MKLSDKMTMLDAIKLIKEIAGDDNAMRDDIRASLYNMADTDGDLSDDSIDTWINAYPEDKHEKLRSLFAGPAVEVVKTKIEGGKNQPPADIKDDTAVADQLAENAETLHDDIVDDEEDDDDAYLDQLIAELETDTPSEEEPPAEKETKSEEPADKESAAEEQDETTRNILAGLSNK